jgi:hypothetical protein
LFKKLITKGDLEDCVTKNCNQEVLACNISDYCIDGYTRFKRCLNLTRLFKPCRDNQLDTRNNTRIIPFQLTDALHCYGLCGWKDLIAINLLPPSLMLLALLH